jgi:hypothetical protein
MKLELPETLSSQTRLRLIDAIALDRIHRLHWRRVRILAAFIAAFCFAVVVAQVRAGESRQNMATTVAKQVPQSAPKAEDQHKSLTELLNQADEVLHEMSRLTGLPIKAPVNKKIVDRDEVRKLLLQNLHTDYTPEEIHVQEATLRAFGLISKDFNLEKLLVSLYTEQAAGFYDPRTRTMYIADWIPPELQKMVLAHELTHALQDQNFGLERYMKAVQKDDDAEAARQAVVEGYATAAMFQSMFPSAPIANLPNLDNILGPLIRQQMTEFPVFSNAPYFFRLQALFPYIQGVSFVASALRRGGWESLGELFTSPPSSTRAIFQPDVYFNHLTVPAIQLPNKTPLGSVPGLKMLAENTMGELGMDQLLGQLLSEQTADAEISKFVADRYIVYENPSANHYALVARTQWTNPEAALAFYRDYHTILAKKFPELSPDDRSGDGRYVGRTAVGDVIVLQTGDEVRWAEGVPADKVDVMIRWLSSLK